MLDSHGSRTYQTLAAEAWREHNEPMSSGMAQTKQRFLLPQEHVQAAESMRAFKQLDLQDNKSLASTEPSKTAHGAGSSKRSVLTRDSKSSFPFSYL